MEPNKQEMNEPNYSYTYTYSAAQKKEMEDIRRKYLPEAEKDRSADSLSRIKQIEARVENIGTVVALVIGLAGLLLLGLGMCGVLVWMDIWFIIGIPVGLVGIGVMATAYPIYLCVIKKLRKKYAPEVLSLTEPK